MIFGKLRSLCVGMILVCGLGFSQTQVDLRNQTRNVDFSGAAATRPVKVGSSVPATCTVGEIFFDTLATPGSNIRLCTATNTWSLGSGSGGGGIAITTLSGLLPTCSVGEMRYVTDASFATGEWLLYMCTAPTEWTAAGLQADGSGFLTVTCSTPNRCLVGPNTAVIPSLTGANTWQGAGNFSTASKTAVFRLASTPPETCDATTREAYFNTATNSLNICTTSDVWTAIGGPHGSALLYSSGGVGSLTANGSTQTVDSFLIPAGTLKVGDVVEIEANFARTGTAANLIFGVSFGGSAVTAVTPTSAAAAVHRVSLVVTGTTQQIWGGTLHPDSTSTIAASSITGSASVDIASAITVSLTQNGTGPDSGQVTSWHVKVVR